MNPETQRVCPFCAESIQAAAKVCPRCRQWLSLRSFRHPVVSVCAAGLVTVAFLVLLAAWASRAWNPPPFYAAFPGSLQIVDSGLNWIERDKEPRIYITGILTNQSPIAWRDIEFECRFYNTNGLMMDAYNARGYLTIQPNDERAFRVSVVPSRPAKDYASHKLSVSTARNTRSPF